MAIVVLSKKLATLSTIFFKLFWNNFMDEFVQISAVIQMAVAPAFLVTGLCYPYCNG